MRGWLVFFCCLSPVLMALTLQPDDAGVRIIAAENEVAVVQPVADEIWVVAAGEDVIVPEAAALRPQGVREIEMLQVNDGQGVRLVLNRTAPWQVREDDGALVLQRGMGEEAPGSLMALQDRLVLADDEILGSILQVQSPQTGQRVRVVPLRQAVAQGGEVQLPSLWGLAVAETTLLETRDVPHQLAWQQGPVPVPEIPLAVDALPDLVVDPQPVVWGMDGFDMAQLPDFIEAPHDPRQVMSFTPLVPTRDPAIMKRVLQFSRAADRVRSALRQVNTLEGQAGPVQILPVLAATPDIDSAVPVQAIVEDEAFLLEIEIGGDAAFFREQEGMALQRLAAADDDQNRDLALMALARLYINAERPRQAAVTLQEMVARPDGVPVSRLGRTLLGAALILDAQPTEGLRMLEGGTEPHRTVWMGAGQVALGNMEAAREAFGARMSQLMPYPDHVLEHLYTAEVQMMLATQQYSALEDRLDEVSQMMRWDDLPRPLKYVLAQAHLELGNTDEGRALLSDIAEGPGDKLAAQAKLAFLQDLARTRDLGPAQEILFLEDLQFEWRGDEVEQEVLRRLGTLYVQIRQYRNALDRWKTYAVAFPDAPDIEGVTADMRAAFLEVFTPENQDLLDQLGLLGLYFDFRELTPADATGDEVVELVADVLDEIVLYRRAADLFEQQLQFRVTDPVNQVVLAVELAALYRKNLDPNLALATLEGYADVVETLPFEVQRARDIELARIYKDLRNYETARALVAPYLDETAVNLQVDLAWVDEDYATLARLLAQRYDTDEHAGFADQRVRNDFVKLTYALVQLRQQAALKQLIENYQEDMRDHPEVADVVNVYATRLRVPREALPILRGRPLQEMTEKLLDLNDFEMLYEAHQARLQERERLREEYNNKMRYMEFLEENNLI